eukprot:g10585.t1
MLRTLLSRYERWLLTHPILSRSTTVCLVASVADLMAQHIEDRFSSPNSCHCLWDVIDIRDDPALIAAAKEDAQQRMQTRTPWDIERVAVKAITGFFCMAPLAYMWQLSLTRLFTANATTVPTVLKKLALDCLLYTPISCISYFTITGLLEGKPVERITKKVQKKTLPTVQMCWSYWPIINFIQFRFVPVVFFVPINAVASFFFSTYLSIINSDQAEKLFDKVKSGEKLTPAECAINCKCDHCRGIRI